MKTILDSEILLGLALPRDFSEVAAQQIRNWKQAGVELYMPQIGEYDITSGLQLAVTQGLITTEEAVESLSRLQALQVISVPPNGELHRAALIWANRLSQNNTNLGQYLALAEHVKTNLWVADQDIAQQIEQLGINWVYWIGNI